MSSVEGPYHSSQTPPPKDDDFEKRISASVLPPGQPPATFIEPFSMEETMEVSLEMLYFDEWPLLFQIIPYLIACVMTMIAVTKHWKIEEIKDKDKYVEKIQWISNIILNQVIKEVEDEKIQLFQKKITDLTNRIEKTPLLYRARAEEEIKKVIADVEKDFSHEASYAFFQLLLDEETLFLEKQIPNPLSRDDLEKIVDDMKERMVSRLEEKGYKNLIPIVNHYFDKEFKRFFWGHSSKQRFTVQEYLHEFRTVSRRLVESVERHTKKSDDLQTISSIFTLFLEHLEPSFSLREEEKEAFIQTFMDPLYLKLSSPHAKAIMAKHLSQVNYIFDGDQLTSFLDGLKEAFLNEMNAHIERNRRGIVRYTKVLLKAKEPQDFDMLEDVLMSIFDKIEPRDPTLEVCIYKAFLTVKRGTNNTQGAFKSICHHAEVEIGKENSILESDKKILENHFSEPMVRGALHAVLGKAKLHMVSKEAMIDKIEQLRHQTLTLLPYLLPHDQKFVEEEFVNLKARLHSYGDIQISKELFDEEIDATLNLFVTRFNKVHSNEDYAASLKRKLDLAVDELKVFKKQVVAPQEVYSKTDREMKHFKNSDFDDALHSLLLELFSDIEESQEKKTPLRLNFKEWKNYQLERRRNIDILIETFSQSSPLAAHPLTTEEIKVVQQEIDILFEKMDKKFLEMLAENVLTDQDRETIKETIAANVNSNSLLTNILKEYPFARNLFDFSKDDTLQALTDHVNASLLAFKTNLDKSHLPQFVYGSFLLQLGSFREAILKEEAPEGLVSNAIDHTIAQIMGRI